MDERRRRIFSVRALVEGLEWRSLRRRPSVPAKLNGHVSKATIAVWLDGDGDGTEEEEEELHGEEVVRRSTVDLTATARKMLRRRLQTACDEEEAMEALVPKKLVHWQHKDDLDLTGIPLHEDDLSVLAFLLKFNFRFSSLSLRRCLVRDLDFLKLEYNTFLKNLDLRQTKITDAAVKKLLKTTRLDSLDVRQCDLLTEKTAAFLFESNLEYVNGMPLGKWKLDLPTELNLRNMHLNRVDISLLTHLIRGPVALDLALNDLLDAGDLLSQLPLTSLILDENFCGDWVHRLITDDLTRLSLRGCHLTPASIENLVPAIRATTSLTSLDLSDNDDIDLSKVLDAVKVNRALRHVPTTSFSTFIHDTIIDPPLSGAVDTYHLSLTTDRAFLQSEHIPPATASVFFDDLHGDDFHLTVPGTFSSSVLVPATLLT